MNSEMSIKDNGKKKTWRKSESNDTSTRSIDVEEMFLMNDKGKLEHAFLVCYYKSDNKDGNYKTDEKKICMKTNPLSDDDKNDLPESDKIKEDFKGWFESPMMEI